MQLHHKGLTVTIDKGELTGFTREGYQFIHQKGTPGWGSSDTEMFPIIGPTAKAHFKVKPPRGEAVMDQHGLYRELEYTLEEHTDTLAIFVKRYKANDTVKNSKYPKKSTEEWLHWPYDFEVKKSFTLEPDRLKVNFEINAVKDMPFMLGYHPAFMIHGDAATVITNEEIIPLGNVMAVGDRAYHVPGCTSITLRDKEEIELTTQGFRDFMLWSPTSNMICIEPITFYPYAVAQTHLDEGFQTLHSGPGTFTITLRPL